MTTTTNTTTKTKLTVGFLVLAALAGVASAAPADDFAVGRKLKRDLNLEKVPVIPNPKHQRNFEAAIRQAELRYNITVGDPRDQRVGGPPGFLPLDIDATWDRSYIAKVQIGTPPQELSLDLDTGSSDFWVFSSDLPPDVTANHNVFDYHKSSTWSLIPGAKFSIGYQDGSGASGNVGRDTVNLGGLSVKKQAVSIAQQQNNFDTGNSDGLIGLGFYNGRGAGSTVSTGPEKTPVDTLIADGTLPPGSQLFTSAFYSWRDPTKSFYTFGYIDEGLVAASGQELKYTPVDGSVGYWTVPSTSGRVNGKVVTAGANQKAIADTGTSLAYLPASIVKELYAQIPDVVKDTKGRYYFPNSSVTALPTFEIAVGSNYWTIQPEDLVYQWIPEASLWAGGVQATDGLAILGDVFLKSVYTVWDRGLSRIGFVPKIEKTQSFEPNKFLN
ncbi:Penicillopepsin-3 [Vanrija pseudolonga]|uniref:Penicillopepsin-3 n=1 Tax=Vanrija pseudolonga TaxID=143232 RepID=A0AAF1BPV3_9TREE|nr:Penicillopepsin-3 [Vanrija pseudolonga]